MIVASYIGLLVGLAVMTALVAWAGVHEIGGLLLASGWTLLWIPLIWLPSLPMNTRCWQLLFVPEHAPRFGQALYAQWIGRAVNTLLPVASIGGDVVKAVPSSCGGPIPAHASAARWSDKTVDVITIVLWGLIGIALLATMALDDGLASGSLIGVIALGFGVLASSPCTGGMFGFMARGPTD
jgi:hypothetical protein